MSTQNGGPSTFNYSGISFGSSSLQAVQLGNVYGTVTNSCAHIPIKGVTQYYTYASWPDTLEAGEHAVLRALNPVHDARWDSHKTWQRHRVCHSDTRVDVLDQIVSWASAGSSPGVFWLAGMAGTGKSTIAMTSCKRLAEMAWDVSSFFFQRGAADMGAATRVVPTISYQLAIRNVKLSQLMTKAIQLDDAIPSLALDKQVQSLLVEPMRVLAASGSAQRVIVVIDALDECDDPDLAQHLLDALVKISNDSSIGLKVLLTSRLNWSIRGFFERTTSVMHRDLELNMVNRGVVDQDIERYVRSELKTLAAKRSLPASWPSDDEVQKVVHLSAGLFIFAATTCRYVDGPAMASPKKRLATICQPDDRKRAALPTQELDRMYAIILDDALSGQYEEEELAEVKEGCRHILEVLVLSSMSVTTSVIALLVSIADETVTQFVRAMHAVVMFTESGEVQILHESFSDYLLDGKRCLDPSILLHYRPGHQRLVDRCLETLQRHLHENICNLRSPGSSRSEISVERLNTILPDGVRYACRRWPAHVVESGVQLQDSGSIHKFLKVHALHWLEAISVLQELTQGVLLLVNLESCIDQQTELSGIVYDLRRFILTYQSAIIRHPLQLYILAAHFMHTGASLRAIPNDLAKRYSINSQHAQNWNGLRLTLGLPGNIGYMQFSPDGSRLIVISTENEQEIAFVADMATGEVQAFASARLPDYREFSTVQLSKSGSIVACESYVAQVAKVEVWTTLTKECLLELAGHHLEHLSEDGITVMTTSRSRPGKINVWSTSNGNRKCEIPGSTVLALRRRKAVILVQTRTRDEPRVEVRDVVTGDYLGSLHIRDFWDRDRQQLYQATLSDCEMYVSIYLKILDRDHLYLFDLERGRRHLLSDQLKFEGPDWSLTDIKIVGGGKDAICTVIEKMRAWNEKRANLRNVQYSMEGELVFRSQQDFDRSGYKHVETIGTGKFLCVRFRDSIAIHDLLQEAEGPHMNLQDFTVCATCDSGAMIAVAQSHTAHVWDIATEVDRALVDNDAVDAATLSLDGLLLVTITNGGKIRLWDVSRGTCCQETITSQTPGQIIRELAVSEDKSTIMFTTSSTGEGIADLWSWHRTSEPAIIAFYAVEDFSTTLAISPDGMRFALLQGTPPAEQAGHVYSINCTYSGILAYTCISPWTWLKPTALCSNYLILIDDWVCRINSLEARYEPLIWLPEDYRPRSSLQFSNLWSQHLKTLSVPSRTGKHSFIRLDTVGARDRLCDCDAEVPEHNHRLAALMREPSDDAKDFAKAAWDNDEAQAREAVEEKRKEVFETILRGEIIPREEYATQAMALQAREARQREVAQAREAWQREAARARGAELMFGPSAAERQGWPHSTGKRQSNEFEEQEYEGERAFNESRTNGSLWS